VKELSTIVSHRFVKSVKNLESILLQTAEIITIRSQAKFLTCEIPDFTPCTHAQGNILHTKYAEKTVFVGLGIRV